MGSCNVTQNETGGKFLNIKICIDKTFGSVATQSNLTATAHGAKVGDLVKFFTLAANTTIALNTFYYITEIVDANTIKISATKNGTAIVLDATGAPTGEIYASVGGIRSKEFGGTSEAIDITNQDSDEWKTILDGAGQKSFTASGSGVFGASAAFSELESKFLASLLTCLMFLDYKTGKAYYGCFKITQLTLSGEYNGEGQYSFSAESSGAVTMEVI